MRIVFMGSPAIAVPCLEQLVIARWQIAAVYTQPDRPAGRGRDMAASPVKEAALKLGIKVLQQESVRTPEALAELRALKPDVIVICAFGQILPQELLDIPPHQCVNVHYSLLPKHRGASPAAAAILAGDDYSGVTVQLVRKKLDTGPILGTAAVPISSKDNTGTLLEKLSVVGAHLLEDALLGWMRGEIEPRQQYEAGATYFPQIKKEDGKIDWSRPAVEIWRRVRAFYPWPGSFTTWQGKQLKINEAFIAAETIKDEPGRVVALQEGGIGVAAGEGVLGITNIQYESKRAMPPAEFIRGQRDFIGSILPS